MCEFRTLVQAISWLTECYSQEFCDEDTEDELKDNEGFAFNRRRGTANFFSADALLEFLKRNNLSHVVRAHEVQQVGFQVTFTAWTVNYIQSCIMYTLFLGMGNFLEKIYIKTHITWLYMLWLFSNKNKDWRIVSMLFL